MCVWGGGGGMKWGRRGEREWLPRGRAVLGLEAFLSLLQEGILGEVSG